jgi:hypothetical protein
MYMEGIKIKNFQAGSDQGKLRYSARNDREAGPLLELRTAF